MKRPGERTFRVRVHGLRLAMTLLVLYALALMVEQQAKAMQLQREIRYLQQQLEALRQEKAELQEQIRKYTDPSVIQQEARRRLGLARPGEIQYFVLPSGWGSESGQAGEGMVGGSSGGGGAGLRSTPGEGRASSPGKAP